MIFAGCLSVSYGIERMYDSRNYHIYNPWAFLTGRLGEGYDVMPAGIQSYFNPFLDIPYYLAIKYFNEYPAIITFLMGFSYAFFLFMIYKISRLVFKNYHPKILSIFCVFIALGGFEILRTLGWLSHDIFLGSLALLSLYLLLKSMEKYSRVNLCLSGFILGLCVGLKYTTVIFALPLGITLLMFCKTYKEPLISLICFSCGGIIGFLLTGGVWMYELYTLFGNPFFPYFNWLFQSPEINLENVYTVDFGRQFSNTGNFLGPFLVEDNRNILLYVMFLFNFMLYPVVNKREFKKMFAIDLNYIDFMLIFCCLAYILWVYAFKTPRYYAPLLGLSAIIALVLFLEFLYLGFKIIGCLCGISDKKRKIVEVSALLCFLVCLIIYCWPTYNLKSEKKLIRVPVAEKLLDIEDLKIPDNSVVLLGEGCGIIVPFQNPQARYIKLNPVWFSREGNNLFSAVKVEQMKKLISEKSDNIYFISDIDLSGADKADVFGIEKSIRLYKDVRKISVLQSYLYELLKLGIDGKNRQCHKIKTNLFDPKSGFEAPYWFCKVELFQQEGAINNGKN